MDSHQWGQVMGLSLVLDVFLNRVSLCSPGYPGAHSVDQAGLELRDLPASASRVLRLKACTIVALGIPPLYSQVFISVKNIH